jgi:hypothetical protein
LHISQLHEQQTSFLLTSLNNIQALFGRFGALASLSFWAELEKNGAKAWNEKNAPSSIYQVKSEVQ